MKMVWGFLTRLFCGSPLEGKPSPPKGNISANYEKYCAQMDKEDDLINSRVNWLLVSQTILFGALAVGEGTLGEPIEETIFRVVAALGISSSTIIWISILGAVRSFCRYRHLLLQVCPEDEDADYEYPQLHRSRFNIVLGFVSPVVVPVLLVVAWCWLLAQG
jgi:hypothetical protein